MLGAYVTNLDVIRKNQPIQKKYGPFSPYFDSICPINVSFIEPGNHQIYLWVQCDTYKIHYMSL